MLALAIEFSRCSRARTLKAEQCVPAGLMVDLDTFHFPSRGRTSEEIRRRYRRAASAIDLESPGMQRVDRMSSRTGLPKAP